MVCLHTAHPFYILSIMGNSIFHILSIWLQARNIDTSNLKEIADPRLEEAYDPVEMERAMQTALMCIHHMPTERPDMREV